MAGAQPYDPSSYEALRSAPLPAAAAALAATGCATPLAALVARHPAALGRHLLGILSALPETLDPRTYSSLLPRADTGAPGGLTIPGPATALPPAPAGPGRPPAAPTGSGGRRTDWCEVPEAWRELAALSQGRPPPGAAAGAGDAGPEAAPAAAAAGGHALVEEAALLLHATEDLERAGLAAAASASAAAPAGAPPPPGGGSLWPSPAEAAAWYVRRAVELDSAAGQLAHALSLVDLALKRGAPPDAPVGVDLISDHAAGGGADGLTTAVTLAQLQAAGRVLAAALRSWYPAAEPPRLRGSALASLDGAAAGFGRAPSLRLGALVASPRGTGYAGDAAGDAAATTDQPAWMLGLGEFLAMPLVRQLEVALSARSEDTLEQEVDERWAAPRLPAPIRRPRASSASLRCLASPTHAPPDTTHTHTRRPQPLQPSQSSCHNAITGCCRCLICGPQPSARPRSTRCLPVRCTSTRPGRSRWSSARHSC